MNMFEEIWKEASKAAWEGFQDCKPTPMIVGQARGLFGNEIIPGTEEVVEDGVCGFAWIQVKPARGPWVSWMKNNDIGSSGVYGGWTLSPMDFDSRIGRSQSMERKTSAMNAALKVLEIYFPDKKMWVESRMD